MAPSLHELLRRIPAIDALLADHRWGERFSDTPHQIVVAGIRTAVDEVRAALRESPLPGWLDPAMDDDSLRESILRRAEAKVRTATETHYRKVINATGVILHTALGRAALPQPAIRQIAQELSGYSLLQADPVTGLRSKRDARIQALFQQLTGAEAATLVNNNAAATWIALSSVAAGREVIVSRGQLVEIGGSFRLPDVMAASGARMVEVGTTNKTHLRDYERAITPNTAAILRVHPSNYRIEGFTAEAPLTELVELAHRHGLAMIDDVGAGALVDLSDYGFDVGPLLAESVRSGADLVLSSTDKLIGASQGGILLGRAAMIEAVRKNPMARIVRVDKLTLAALEATLVSFIDPARALREVPTLRMVCRPLDDIAQQAARIAQAVASRVPAARIEVIEGQSQMGGGSLPGQSLPTRLVAITSEAIGPDELARRLRVHRPAVFARINKDQVLLDPRTMLEGDEPSAIEAVVEALTCRTAIL